MIELPDPQQVDQAATQNARVVAEAATRPQAPAFVPPPPSSWQGEGQQSFTPPPVSAWEGEAKPQSAAESMGVKNPWLAAPIDFLEGIGSGAMSTIYHGGDLIRRGLGMERIIDRPEVKRQMTPPDSMAGKGGKFAEQGAEYLAPMGAVSKVTHGAHLLVRMGAEGLTSAGMAGLQTGGDPESMKAGAMTGAAGPAVGAGLSAGGRAIANSKIPEKLYQSALKPTWSMAKKDGLEMLKTGAREEQVPVGQKGLKMIEDRIEDLRKEIGIGVQVRAAQGKTVDTSKVLDTLADLKKFYGNTAAPAKPLKAIQDLEDEFRSFHGNTIPLDKAQQIKINTYQLIKDSYGEFSNAKVEGLKQVARGLKEQISSVFPEVANLNEQQSKLLGLDEAMTRAVWRIENHQLMGIGSPLAAAGGHAVLGGPGATVAFVGKILLDDPTLKSKLAIALARQGVKNPQAIVSLRMAALKAMMQKAATSLASSPEQSSGQRVPALAQ